MNPETTLPWARELAAYEQHRVQLERRQCGKIALLHGDELLGAFATREDALQFVIERYGRPEPCLWQEIGRPVDLKPLWGLPPDELRLSEGEPAEPSLTREMTAYERHRVDLERDRRRQFALLRGDTLIGVFADEDAALAEGRRRFGREPFLLREIGDPVLSFALCELPRKREG